LIFISKCWTSFLPS